MSAQKSATSVYCLFYIIYVSLICVFKLILKHADHEIPDDMRVIDYITDWVRTRMLKTQKDFGGLKDRILILHSSVGTGDTNLI
jgi:hypothetical protein